MDLLKKLCPDIVLAGGEEFQCKVTHVREGQLKERPHKSHEGHNPPQVHQSPPVKLILYLENQPIVSLKATDGSNELVGALPRTPGIQHFGGKAVHQCILWQEPDICLIFSLRLQPHTGYFKWVTTWKLHVDFPFIIIISNAKCYLLKDLTLASCLGRRQDFSANKSLEALQDHGSFQNIPTYS